MLDLVTMSEKTERINVIVTRVISPVEFWIKIPTGDYKNESSPLSNTNIENQKTYSDYLRWIKGIISRFGLNSTKKELIGFILSMCLMCVYRAS